MNFLIQIGDFSIAYNKSRGLIAAGFLQYSIRIELFNRPRRVMVIWSTQYRNLTKVRDIHCKVKP